LLDVKINSTTFISILPTFSTTGNLEGMYIHQRVFEYGFSLNVMVVSALIKMYLKYKIIEKAHKFFDSK